VIGPALIRRAWALELPGIEAGCFGLDVARSVHGDESALYRDRGGQVRSVWVGREADSTNLASIVLRATRHVPAVPVGVDTDGVGGPVHDLIRRGLPDLGLQGRTTIAFSVAGTPHNRRDFDTRRSEVWWLARQELEKGLWDLDEADDELVGAAYGAAVGSEDGRHPRGDEVGACGAWHPFPGSGGCGDHRPDG
jgi:hypothetical protein